MADRSVKRDSTDGSSPAQAAGKRIRRPPPQTTLVTRRTSSRRSTVSRRTVASPRKHVRKSSKADDDMSEDDSDTDPAWMPDATKPAEETEKKVTKKGQRAKKKVPPVALSCSTSVDQEEPPLKKDYTRRRKTCDPVEVKVEGSFKTGDYIMAVEDRNKARPPIWRIEGRSLLQRFEPMLADGLVLHRNISSFSAWNSLEQSKYTNITVRIHSNSRSATVVQVLDNPEDTKNGKRKIDNLLDKYQVYLQTLLSHVLDPNFLAEVHRENDEYFLSNLQAIDSENDHWRNSLRGTHRWSPDLFEAVTSFPRVNLTEHNADTACQSCQDNGVSFECSFSGCHYGRVDLCVVEEEPQEERKQLCSLCVEPLQCYSRLYHYKLHTFHKCKEKVEGIEKEGKLRESHIILEHCLQDDEWVNQMLLDLENLWQSCS
ncbi:uncharacterized protein LOC135395115 isoform X2 [Ornithodoros turicata]|uniref:uncharacterized protein LOC135395115 isoform X2 n=1 Tax=Ornithodoros turicata TaxID=34597 RepID=UPI003138AD40